MENKTEDNLNKMVRYENPFFISTDWANIGYKYKTGVIVDYDGEYFIIEFEKDKTDYIHKDKIKEELKEQKQK